MPFTPFHFGPGVFGKAAVSKYYSVSAFIITQVVIDCETLYYILKGVYPIHCAAHTLLGASATGLSVGLFLLLIARVNLFRGQLDHLGSGLIGKSEVSVTGVLTGGTIGGISHSILDAIMHPDVRPFAPWSKSNPFLDVVSLSRLHLFCVISGIVGACVILYKINREEKVTRMSVEQEISKELGPGEHILWSGIPKQGILFRAADAFLVPFSLLWGGFAVFWETTVIASGAPWFFKLWGIPFVLIGLHFIFGRFLVDARQRKGTFYGVTNQRAIIVSGIFGRSVKSLVLRNITDISLTERTNGSGTISFGQSNTFHSFFGNASWPGINRNVPCFDTIDTAKQVYNIIRNAQSPG